MIVLKLNYVHKFKFVILFQRFILNKFEYEKYIIQYCVF